MGKYGHGYLFSEPFMFPIPEYIKYNRDDEHLSDYNKRLSGYFLNVIRMLLYSAGFEYDLEGVPKYVPGYESACTSKSACEPEYPSDLRSSIKLCILQMQVLLEKHNIDNYWKYLDPFAKCERGVIYFIKRLLPPSFWPFFHQYYQG